MNLEVIEGTEITFEQFTQKKIFYAKQNKPADLETIKFYGLAKTLWHKIFFCNHFFTKFSGKVHSNSPLSYPAVLVLLWDTHPSNLPA